MTERPRTTGDDRSQDTSADGAQNGTATGSGD